MKETYIYFTTSICLLILILAHITGIIDISLTVLTLLIICCCITIFNFINIISVPLFKHLCNFRQGFKIKDDIYVIGTSRAVCSVNARLIEENCNYTVRLMGGSIEPLKSSYFILKKIVKNKPKIIFMETFTLTLHESYLLDVKDALEKKE